MIKQGVITALMLLIAMTAVQADELRSGIIIEEMQCSGSEEYSYMLYLPLGYTPARELKWPVLFVMGPEGGTEEGIRRYIRGAEKNGWIVAMSIQSKNGFELSKNAVAAMVRDVTARLAVDEQRCYASGMSSGARLAFWLANRKKDMIIGIIPCGGGDTGNRYRTHAHAYGLCGGYCFTRWDMAITFKEHIRRNGRLRFFEGGHVWADENLIFDAITWLNGKYLAEHGTTEEIDRFSTMLLGEIVEQYRSNPYFSYENAVVLAEIKEAPLAREAREIADKLAEDPRIIRYLAGLAEMDEFVEKYFNTDADAYRTQRLTPRQHEQALNLLDRYGDTPLAPIIKDFGRPSKKF